MKKILFLAVAVFCIAACRGQENPNGTWSGKLDVPGGRELNIVMHLDFDEEGVSGTLDCPDQGLRGLPLESPTFEYPDLYYEIPMLHVVFKGKFDGAEIEGVFTQKGVPMKLVMKRGDIVLNRPQEPKPPFPYNSEDITFPSRADDIVMAGTLTMPAEGERFPAVLMVTGSGAQNRDEEILGHKPFLVIADHLTRNGIAVLRYDDRGFGQSGGTFSGATSEDFTYDALGAFDYLKSRAEIDNSKIGVIGHSEGGMIGFMMASREPELAFVVSMAGSLLPGDSVLVLQNMAIMPFHGFGPVMVDLYGKALGKAFKFWRTHSHAEIVAAKDEILDSIEEYHNLLPALKQNLEAVLIQDGEWLHYFVTTDPAEGLNVQCPVLALNGDKDIQVIAEPSLEHIRKVLKDMGNENVTTICYPNMNHLFQETESGDLNEYGKLEQTITPVVLDDIAKWILDLPKY